jgi:hypothetical protein
VDPRVAACPREQGDIITPVTEPFGPLPGSAAAAGNLLASRLPRSAKNRTGRKAKT